MVLFACLKQLLHKYQLLFGFESKTDSSSQPSCDRKTSHLQKCMCSFLIQPRLFPLEAELMLDMDDFHRTTFIFGDFSQLINELGAIDARLTPQYCELLSGGEKYTGSKMRASVRKERVSSFSCVHMWGASFPWEGLHYIEYLCCQKPGEPVPEIEEDSNSDLDEEAALRFYRKIEEQVKLKRKAKTEEDEE